MVRRTLISALLLFAAAAGATACSDVDTTVSPAAVTAECQTCLNDAQSGCGAELGACAGQ
jgi:hypothetical protein